MKREELAFTHEGVTAGVTLVLPDEAAGVAGGAGSGTGAPAGVGVGAGPAAGGGSGSTAGVGVGAGPAAGGGSGSTAGGAPAGAGAEAGPDDGAGAATGPDAGALADVLVLYLHGGGLLYGERDDLPLPYLELLCDAGCAVACADYPLAPEATLPEIQAFLDALWTWCAHELAPQLGRSRLVLLGRSSGAYLALTLAGRLSLAPDAVKPSGVIDLYGYGDMGDSALAAPSDTYRAFPAVSKATVSSLVGEQPVTSGPKALRYALYVYARQQGTWGELLGLPDGRDPFALTAEQKAAMPPVFYAASTGDEDVPYAVSKRLARELHARMQTVYGLPHDFDRDTENPAGRQVYQAIVTWMEGLPTA